jgi:ubiquinone/menaquinone biosynthesis C-methylase UbiE
MEIKGNIKLYWNTRSATYDKYPVSRSEEEERSAYRDVLKRSLSGNRLKILDVGTGTGFIALILSEMGHKITGIDIAEKMLEIARQKTRGNGHNVSFQLGDVESLSFDNTSFDVVVCRYLLWTLPNPWEALNEWHRVVKPGGSILCIEGKWHDSSLRDRFKRFNRQMGLLLYERANPRKLGYNKRISNQLPFCNGLTPEEAAELFKRKGLTDISIEMLSDIRNIQAHNMPLLYKLAMPPATFLIRGKRN